MTKKELEVYNNKISQLEEYIKELQHALANVIEVVGNMGESEYYSIFDDFQDDTKNFKWMYSNYKIK